MDAKGRIALPSRYRDDLKSQCSGKLVATIDTESRCLLLFPTQEWEVLERQIQALSSFDPDTRRVQRLLIGHACDLELDANGRISLPQELRSYAGLEKKVALIGQGGKFEIWSQENWNGKREEWLAESTTGDGISEELRKISL